MQTARFHAIKARLSSHNIRTSFRRSTSLSSQHSVESSSSSRNSLWSAGTVSPVDTINSVMFEQPAVQDMQAERRSFGSELTILEPRPLVYWGGVEERMESL